MSSILVLILLTGATVASAGTETFELFNGGRIEGELLNPDQSPRVDYQIRLTRGDTITLTTAQVKGRVEKSEAHIWYETWVSKMPDGVEGNLKMAQACKQRGLATEAHFHFQNVIATDPNHEEARRALGYSKINGEWTKQDIYFRERGFVRHKGKWRVPQEIELEQIREAQREIELEWSKKIRLWRSWATRRRNLAVDGMANLAAIDDPQAAPILAEMLQEKDEPRELRRIYVEVLGPMHVPASTFALARRVLVDADEHIRDRALEFLARRQDKGAVRIFTGSLQDSNNHIVNRAAMALNRMQDPDAILPLIEALTTKHKFLVTAGGGDMNPTFTSGPNQGGMGGFSAGGKPQIILQELQNGAVRDALVSITSGANFGYNKEAWRTWYSLQNLPDQVNLRRDL
jgi:hypothetical protein